MLYGGCSTDSSGSIEGAGEAIGAAMFRLVVIPGTGVAGNQTGAREMTCWTGNCSRGDQKRPEERNQTEKNEYERAEGPESDTSE